MRTAVLFFGEIRGCPENWIRLQNLLVLVNNADVFIHGFKYNDDIINRKIAENENFNVFVSNKGIHKEPPPKLFEIFNPKLSQFEYAILHEKNEITDKIIKITNDNIIDGDGWKNITGYNAIKNQLYSRSRVTELKIKYENENNFQYDNIILTRLDFNILDVIKFTEKLDNIKVKIWGWDMIAEQIISGNNNDMNIFKYIYRDSDYLYLQDCHKNHFYQNEYYMRLYIAKHNISMEHYNYPSDYSCSRNGLLRFDKDFVELGESCNIIQRI
jgi:hypothetical protein